MFLCTVACLRTIQLPRIRLGCARHRGQKIENFGWPEVDVTVLTGRRSGPPSLNFAPACPQARSPRRSASRIPPASAPPAAHAAPFARRESSRAVAEDESSSSAVYQPAVAPEQPSGADVNAAAKKRLLAVAAASGRGLDATPAQKTAASSLIGELIAANPNPEPATSPTIDGDWELIYSDTFLFRSSPFFWAVGSMMGDTADFFYQAHSHQTGIFGGGVGRVVQTVDTKGGRLISDCVVKASVGLPLWDSPDLRGIGSVITAGRCAARDGTRLAVTRDHDSETGRRERAAAAQLSPRHHRAGGT